MLTSRISPPTRVNTRFEIVLVVKLVSNLFGVIVNV